MDTRQKFVCAKCGREAKRKFETSDYCYKCWKLEQRFDALIAGGNEVLAEPPLCVVGKNKKLWRL